MVGAVQRQEALGMPCRGINVGGVIDRDGRVGRGMEDEQRAMQRGNALALVLHSKAVDQLLADTERPLGEMDFRASVALDRRKILRRELFESVGYVERRVNGRDSPH